MDVDNMISQEEASTSVYTCKIKDRQTIASEGDKQVIELDL